jgi:hypothetical protein
MPARANSLKSAFIAGTLAAAALPSFNTTASSATECRENPHLRTVQPGHWYYRSDRPRHRPCWFFVPAEVTTDRPMPARPAATVAGDSQQSLLPFFTPNFLPPPPPQQMEVPQTQPNTIPDRSGEVTQAISPKPARRNKNKSVRRERPPIAPPPTTTGAADPRDQPKQTARDGKPESPLNEADRESLFQDFVKWQLDRNLFGRP